MIAMLGSAYPWIKAAHIIFVIFWMAGMFMLPRYLVYHQEALEKTGAGSAEAQLWVERENKLRKMILTPSMILVWLLGLTLAANLGLFGYAGARLAPRQAVSGDRAQRLSWLGNRLCEEACCRKADPRRQAIADAQ